MSNTFSTPKAVSTIAQSRIDYNTSITSLLDNFASTGAPGPASIFLEGTAGLRTGMLWYKSGTDTADGQGRLFVYNGNEFTRNGLNTYKVSSVSAANSAVSSGALEYGELVLVGTDALYIVNSANTGVIPLSVGTASNSELLDGLDSSQFLRSDQDDATSGKLTVSSNLSVGNNIGVGIANPIYPIQVARDAIIVKLNDTNGTIGASIDSYISFDASGVAHGEVGFANTTVGELLVRNRQGNVSISADSNNLRANSAIRLDIDGSTKVTIRSSNVSIAGDLTVSGDINSASDLRLKSNVSNITGALDIVLQMRGVNYTKKDSGKNNIGLIAQEVENLLPDLVSEDAGYKAVAYQNIVALLIEAIKEQQQQIESLKRG